MFVYDQIWVCVFVFLVDQSLLVDVLSLFLIVHHFGIKIDINSKKSKGEEDNGILVISQAVNQQSR